MRTEAWIEDAACRVSDADFYPSRGESLAPALQVCASCSVRLECLAYCLSLGELGEHGVWGGTSERERRFLRHAVASIRRAENRVPTIEEVDAIRARRRSA